MNAKRRKQIQKIVEQIREIETDESLSNDNMIDGTQAKDDSDEALSLLGEAIDTLESI